MAEPGSYLVAAIECIGCGALMDGSYGSREFTGAPVVPAGRWISRDGKWLHMCRGYAEEPSQTRVSEIWR